MSICSQVSETYQLLVVVHYGTIVILRNKTHLSFLLSPMQITGTCSVCACQTKLEVCIRLCKDKNWFISLIK